MISNRFVFMSFSVVFLLELISLSWILSSYFPFVKNILFIFLKILFIFREKGREGERETSMCGCLSHAPYWGPGLQPRHVPCLGIKPATLYLAQAHTQFTEPHQPGLFIYFRDWGSKGEREGEKQQCGRETLVVTSHTYPT